jgi:hypothetical protein
MARQRKPENETLEQARVRQMLESIANNSDRSEKTSWNRKMDNMVKLLSRLTPIEDQMAELEAQRVPIIDDIQDLRQLMVKECIHPFDHLVYHDNHVKCKFCERNISVPKEFVDGEDT